MADNKIATSPLFIGYALAHNVGDEVPAANVKANGWEDGVAGPGSQAAKKAQDEAANNQGLAAVPASPEPDAVESPQTK